ncbi:MAG: 3-oxoacyl-ACP reductase FabG [Acidobacteria bacterium]|nr:3-oxoacyl-ACP reductase FabG [Acidobacteriota bacterium]MCI0723303.1 3-oxoacyl-ACP reductase FabG [Acidobacteriota bacterium]
MRLMKKVAIITGSGRGIGREIAILFASEGARIVIADVNAENARRAAADITGTGGEAYGLEVDITDPAQVESLMQQTLNKCGRLDILVNNAGVGLNKPFLDTSLEEWERVVRINLTGTFLCAQSAAREMVRRGSGKIINVASISGQRGGQGRAAYGAAKAGVILLTQVMAVELAPKGISVNAIAPGPVDTDQSRETHTEATRHAYHERLPIKRYGELREIANAALFLASDESSFIAGHVLNVDGGFRAAGLMFDADDELPRRDQSSEPLRLASNAAPPAGKRRIP